MELCNIRLFIFFLLISLALNCKTIPGKPIPQEPTPILIPEPTDKPLRLPITDCIPLFIKAKKYYSKYKELKPLDTSNFVSAIDLYKQAVSRCKGLEYEDDSIFSLANSYFYVGDYQSAAKMYRLISKEMPDSDLNVNNFCLDEAQFLERCAYDVKNMNYFRLANLYELHNKADQAVSYYKKASVSYCVELKRRCIGRIKELKRPEIETDKQAPSQISTEELIQLIPAHVQDRKGWAKDILRAFTAHNFLPDASNVCAVLSIIQQESGFNPDPPVPNVGRKSEQEVYAWAKKYGGRLGEPLIHRLLEAKPPGESATFGERLRGAKSEHDVDIVYRGLVVYYQQNYPKPSIIFEGVAEMFSDKKFEDFNPITTVGSMQVSVRFAQELGAMSGQGPWEVREYLYTRYGGLHYGILRLLGYPTKYTKMIFRFADYNVGQYASRNAAVQLQVKRLVGYPIAIDGDILRYSKDGKPESGISQTESVIRLFAKNYVPDLSKKVIRQDIEKEKSYEFENTNTYQAIKKIYKKLYGKPEYAALPIIKLESLKISRPLTTSWFAKSVNRRYQSYLKKAKNFGK